MNEALLIFMFEQIGRSKIKLKIWVILRGSKFADFFLDIPDRSGTPWENPYQNMLRTEGHIFSVRNSGYGIYGRRESVIKKLCNSLRNRHTNINTSFIILNTSLYIIFLFFFLVRNCLLFFKKKEKKKILT